MSRIQWSWIAALGFSAAASTAVAQDQSIALRVDALQRQLESQQAELDRLKKLQADGADEQHRGVVEALQKDAAAKSNPGSLTGIYDRGLVIRSGDGNFELRPQFWAQFRHVVALQSEDPEGIDHGFEIRRLRIRADGHAISKDLTYGLQIDGSRSGGNFTILDAWAAYRFRPDWSVRVGQFKARSHRERDVNGLQQLFVDRTLLDALIGGGLVDRVQGVSLIYGPKDGPTRGEITLHDGGNSRNTTFVNPNTDNGYFGVSGRLEHKLQGAWADYRDFTAHLTKQNLLVLGAGFDFTQLIDTNRLLLTADAQYKNGAGFALFGALYLGHLDFREDPNFDSRIDYGASIQLSQRVSQNIELLARYAAYARDDDATREDGLFNELTLGANYYFGTGGEFLHRAKLSLDVVYLPDGVPAAQQSLGYVGDDEAQFLLRSQFSIQI